VSTALIYRVNMDLRVQTAHKMFLRKM